MAPRVDNSDRAGQLVHNYYDYISKTPWIAPIVSTYEKTKHSHGVVEEGLGWMESSLLTLSTLLLSATLWAISTFYTTPKRRVTTAARRGAAWMVEWARAVVGWSVNLATLSLGILVVSIQAALSIAIGGASMGVDGVGAVKEGTRSTIERGAKMGRSMRKMTRQKMNSTVRIVMVPVNFVARSTHSLLDLVEGFLDNRMEMPVSVAPDASILTRIRAILRAISEGLTTRAHAHVLDPAHAQLESLIEQTKKSLVVLEMVREKGNWAAGKMGDASSAVSQLKKKIEEEAKAYRVSPEVILLRGIHSSTQALTKNILILKEKNSKVFGDVALFDGVVDQLEKMAESLKEKRDIYEVRDELISQTRDQLVSLSHSIRQ